MRDTRMMSVSTRRNRGCIVILSVLLAGCAPVQTREAAPGPPPAQNVIGATDELQLVTELALDLARQHGADRILVGLEVDNTLLAAGPEACEGDWPAGSPATVQTDAAAQVIRLQDAGLRVIAMSSRAADCYPRTAEQLSLNGFDFRRSAWPPGYFPSGDPDDALVYRDGILMGNGADRGQMVTELLERSGTERPVLIVLADERQDNLNAVMKAFSFSSTKVHAWRYTRDASVAVSALE